jgi:protocatechuate 3,4-dioxygenase alpha subunit
VTVPKTPSQTVGPYYAIGLSRRDHNQLVEPDDGAAIVLRGELLDGEGATVADGMVEVFDPVGGRWGRCGTHPVEGRAGGSYSFLVAKPAAAVGQAPHLEVYVHARGLLKHQLTRIYFPDEPAANAGDAVLGALAADDRARLIAEQDAGGLRFDIHLQGPRETIFFAT